MFKNCFFKNFFKKQFAIARFISTYTNIPVNPSRAWGLADTRPPWVGHSADDFCETRAALSLRLSMNRQSTCQVTWQMDCLCLGNQRVIAVWVYSLLLVFDVGNFSSSIQLTAFRPDICHTCTSVSLCLSINSLLRRCIICQILLNNSDQNIEVGSLYYISKQI